MEYPFTNALIKETSPYLLQHAHNPVNWYPWGEDALLLAKKLDRPILVSIGYSACHWCHVMERESFENEAVAGFMNEHFINIKIDREERPDLDHIYMEAVQILNGNGGWPLNVFLTTEKRPFYGGTYFPPKPAFNRPSWLDVLQFISDAWKNRRNDVQTQADQLTAHISSAEKNFISKELEGLFNDKDSLHEICLDIRNNLLNTADKAKGGFGVAPKFPQFFCIRYLLEYSHYYNDEEALNHALLSLDSMLDGGIYDQLGGGLSRYSTDDEWHAPHFEKMLYDNALLVEILSEAFQKTEKEKYRKAIEETINFCNRELKHIDGGYYSAIDADSEGQEGKFYVWGITEIQELLGNDADIFCKWYNIKENGNWEGDNILHPGKDLDEFATQNNTTKEELEKVLQHSKKLLFNRREARIRPHTDDKILLSWNALMVSALCKSAASTGEKHYMIQAISTFQFLENVFTKNNFELFHDYKAGTSKNPGFLDDYACMVKACISLQEVTANQDYLLKARGYTEHVLKHFSSEESDLFCYTAKEQADLPLRKTEIYDSALPSGNSIMAQNLLYLSVVFDNGSWGSRAQRMMGQLSGMARKYPGSFGVWSVLMLRELTGNLEVVVAGNDTKNFLQWINRLYLPNKILQSSAEKRNFPLFSGKIFEGEPLVYVCKGNTCHEPTQNISQILKFLK